MNIARRVRTVKDAFSLIRRQPPSDSIVRSLTYGVAEGDGMRRKKTAREIADLIERFLTGTSLYPQEWNDFVECSERDRKLDAYRKRCYDLDPLVNIPGPPDAAAIAELKSIVAELRRLEESN